MFIILLYIFTIVNPSPIFPMINCYTINDSRRRFAFLPGGTKVIAEISEGSIVILPLLPI